MDVTQIFGRQPVVLVVDDERELTDYVSEVLASMGILVALSYSGHEALSEIKATHFDLVISDVLMPKLTGTQLLSKVRALSLETTFVFMTGNADADEIINAVRLGAVDFLEKPFKAEELRMTLWRALHISAREQSVMELLRDMRRIDHIPQAEKIDNLRRQITMLRSDKMRKKAS